MQQYVNIYGMKIFNISLIARRNVNNMVKIKEKRKKEEKKIHIYVFIYICMYNYNFIIFILGIILFCLYNHKQSSNIK